ncbi:MAG: biotin/lipoyl-containing protein, partial [Sphingomonadales bacterium]
MTIEVLMPALSPTMTEGTLAKWLVKEGDAVSSGDAIAEIETDKATMEVEAADDGTVGRIVVAEGTENVAVNSVIAILLEDGEEADAIGEVKEKPSPKPASADDQPEDSEVERDEGKNGGGGESAPARAPVHEAPEEDDLPADATFREITVREALRDAMAEEMRRDENVFLMGEEVAEYQGAYKVSQGLLDEFGSRRVVDTPITEHGF